ncbi:MAG: efflux RND transporter permease subunit [Deltaproteobacteria bacterium]|nr:efflux RND transporter permease subunit [Deltaproteobacteria bacterium]
MLDRIINFSLDNRFLVIVLTLFLLGYGAYVTLNLPVDAFPDVTNVQVVINTEAPGLAAEEVEQLITFPIESVMTGLPDITDVRSLSKTGLSAVTIVFEDDVDIYFARRLVLERLGTAKERIPKGLGAPEMGPISTGLGQIYQYTLEGEGYSLMDLRTVNDWTVKLLLRTVPGVTDILSFGGTVKQYQVNINPNALLKYDLTVDTLVEKIEQSNLNAGGWYLKQGAKQLVVRGVGLLRGGEAGLADIENIVLSARKGTPVYVRDIAKVEFGPEIRQGAVSKNGKGEKVSGTVLMLQGANSKKVIDRVKQKIDRIQDSLPDGMRIIPYYDQADLVQKAITTVTSALKEAAVLIIAVLFLFLGNVRSSLIVLVSIPISMLISFICMDWAGMPANLQSLSGLAIGIGMMVDGSVVMVENIYRHLAESDKKDNIKTVVAHAAREVARPVFFAVLIIVIVFLPLFTLTGVEGKMFSPVAFSISFAMAGSLVVALTVVPMLCLMILRGKLKEEDVLLIRSIKKVYLPLVRKVIKHPFMVALIATGLLLASLTLLPFIGTEFVPELEEGTLNIRVTMNPSISLDKSLSIAKKLEKRLLKYPEVTSALSRIGRAEIGGDPEPVSNNEIYVGLKPMSEWKTAGSRQELVKILHDDLSGIPGLLFNFTQPIATRVDELISGVKAQIAIKLFGGDLDVLEQKGREIESAVKTISGAADVQLEQISGESQLVIRAIRPALARHGVNVNEVMELVSNAIGGESVTDVIDGQKRFAVYTRLAEQYRSDPESIKNLLIATPDGMRIPLSQVASVKIEEGPPTISREKVQRRITVMCNVRGRDMGGFVAEAQQIVKDRVDLPPGYYVEWGGQFENQIRAQRTLMVVVPLAIFLIFVLLYMTYGAARPALLIILNVPFAAVGGIVALYLSGEYLSVPSSIGFIALSGVAVLNGVVLVSYIIQLRNEGESVEDAVLNGVTLRLRPVLMTASVAALGLIPLLLSSGVGAEVQRPLAVVVIGGLISSTLLTLLVLPALYRWFDLKPREVEF